MNKQIRQKIVEQGVSQIIKQGGFATEYDDDGRLNCTYRGSNGRKCHVGALIKDEVYDPIIENAGATSSYVKEMLSQSGFELDMKDIDFLQHFQDVHDHYSDNDDFAEYLKDVKRFCEKYKLKVPNVVNEYEAKQ